MDRVHEGYRFSFNNEVQASIYPCCTVPTNRQYCEVVYGHDNIVS